MRGVSDTVEARQPVSVGTGFQLWDLSISEVRLLTLLMYKGLSLLTSDISSFLYLVKPEIYQFHFYLNANKSFSISMEGKMETIFL